LTTRTDIHSPTNLVTEHYTYIGGFDHQAGYPPESPAAKTRAKLREFLRSSERPHGDTDSQCDHCGAWLRYVAVLLHAPTGGYIAVGEQCLGNRFSRATADFQRLRAEAKLQKENAAIKAAWGRFVTEHPEVDWDSLTASTNSFVVDVLDRGQKFGSLTVRQLEAIQKAVARDAAKAAQPPEVKTDAPTGKVTFTGKVVSRKIHHSQFGATWKITVKVTEPDGKVWLCWVTEPKGVGITEVGDTVTITATLTRSDRDPAFSFGKRPVGQKVAA
jgi:hypothetical protein